MGPIDLKEPGICLGIKRIDGWTMLSLFHYLLWGEKGIPVGVASLLFYLEVLILTLRSWDS
jgi:hypothetical protein